jgi:Rps23 Pro-64 3,4-dihydroxylase Tpa1-like proline 4-hydroxylase
MNLPTPDTEKYLSAKPFPHIVLDDVFVPYYIDIIHNDWPKKHENMLNEKDQKLKAYTKSEKIMEPWIAKFILSHFQSQEFILFLEELTGIKGLVMDIRGGYALHETMPGGKLMPHLDYMIHDITGLQHRVNAILYLNEVEGGELELYTKDHAYGGYLISQAKIAPKFNRMAIFNITPTSWHGHPNPVKGLESRKSIALNYFTLPEKDAKNQQTIFAGTGKSRLKQFIPPILYKLLKK